MKNAFQLLLLFFLCLSLSIPSQSQCVTGTASGNANLIDNMDGTYQIACDGGNVNISSSTFDATALPVSDVQWTSGQTGNFVFTPDCTNLGCFQFAPCVPAGTNVPLQCVSLGSLGVPLSGTVPSGGSENIVFSISGICYIPGTTYSGDLGINLSGSGDVSLSVIQPDGVTQGPLTFDLDLINGLSPIPLSLLGLDVDPNGTWTIVLEDAGAGSYGYTIDPNSDICIDANTTAGVLCSDPIEVCVVEGCPTFVGVQASATDICSGGSFQLSANLNPASAANVTYAWSGTGISGGAQSSANPSVTVTNTTCAAVVETYNLNMTCTNDGSNIASNVQVQVTVHPEIDPSLVVIDNTSNITDPGCSISVSYPPCPSFAITGNTSFSPGDNGTTVNYTVSNGNSACDVQVSSPVTCIGACSPAVANVVANNCAGGTFTIDVNVTSLGTSTFINIQGSDGSTQNGVTSTGTFTFGPYASGTVVNFEIVDPLDAACNVNLGNFTNNCFTCPNLMSLGAIATTACDGGALNLVANMSGGVQGVDYSVQWFENGNAIPGGTTASFTHTPYARQRCASSSFVYSAEVTCLNSGTPATTTTLSHPAVTVYPVPVLGVDFLFENCSVTPIDNCGGLVINTGGATDPAPGASTTVNYIVSVAGAPASCQTTGSITLTCPNCPDYPGNASSTDMVVCWGDDFDVSNTNALVSSLGYEVGYVVTPSPPSSYPNTTTLLAASLNGVNGPFAAPGSITPQNFVNDGSLITPAGACGSVLYFTPFVSFACQSYNAENSSGTVETPPGSDFIAGIYQTPGISGVTLAVPQVPFCSGLVSYNIQLCVNDETDDGAGLFGLCFAGEDPLQMSSLFGLIGGLPGGGFSNFPNINNVHDSQQNVCYNQNGWTADPSGELINIVTVNLQDFCAGGNDSDFMGWDFSVNVNCNSVFPTICADCDVLGAPVAVRLLPQLTIANIPPQAPLCAGESIDLEALNPSPSFNGPGFYDWYEGPSANNVAVPNPSQEVPAIGTTQYCVTYSYCSTGDCVVEKCVTITVDPLPAVNSFNPSPICPGDSFDLTTMEAGIATGGSFNWYVGGDSSNGGALIANPTNVTPIGTQMYCAEFMDASTGCTSTVCSSFNYLTNPILIPTAPVVCDNSNVDLSNFNSMLTTSAGTFTWYTGNPFTGGTVIGNTLFAPYNSATDGTSFWVEFTDATSGCSAFSIVNLTVNPSPTINTGFTPAILCANSGPYDLTIYESALGNGIFNWYDNNPLTIGVAINPTSVAISNGSSVAFWFELNDPVTGCTSLGNIIVTVSSPVTGATAVYDCNLDQLVVNLSGATGGTPPYSVSASSPNNAGDVLANGNSYSVIIVDSNGCAQTTLTGSANCCPLILNITTNYLPTDVITDQADILVTSTAIVPANADIRNISQTIILNSGFEAVLGADYHAFIGDCSTP